MSDKSKHWMSDSSTRAGFWAFAKGDLGLTEAEVHLALNCESVFDYAGTKKQAIKILRAYAAHNLYAAAQALPEPPMLIFTDFVSEETGRKWAYTFRVGLPPFLRALALEQVRDAVRDFEALAKTEGWLVPGALNGAPARQLVAAESLATDTGPPARPQDTLPVQSGNGGGSETFLAESVTAQVSPNGNRYYAVKGGRCKMHGVTAWPEVAEPQLEKLTGYNPEQLEVGQLWDIAGFSIQAVAVIPAGKEYPNKVTAFAPIHTKEQGLLDQYPMPIDGEDAREMAGH